MNDIVVIGGGEAGQSVASRYAAAGYTVVVVERNLDLVNAISESLGPKITVLHGDGTFAGRNLVAILDVNTADEKRLIPASTVVIATGERSPKESHHQLLGIAKLGIVTDPETHKIKTNSSGLTRCENIYAVGACSELEAPENLNIVFPSPTTHHS